MFIVCSMVVLFFFFFKQKTAYEMRISDWSSDVCSSDLQDFARRAGDDRVNLRMFFRPEMVGRHHPAQGVRKASLWIGQKGGNARQCLFFLGIEHMKDRADQQRMGDRKSTRLNSSH